MDLNKLNPWNWFKHEDNQNSGTGHIPVKKGSGQLQPAWSGSHPLWQLHDQFERLFDDLWRGFGATLPSSAAGSQIVGGFHPAVDVSSKGDKYEITVEAPGLEAGDISIEQVDDRLVIRGEKKEEIEDRERHYYRMERRYGAFQRILSLPDDADAGNIDASMQKGILRLSVPRKQIEKSAAKRIAIRH